MLKETHVLDVMFGKERRRVSERLGLVIPDHAVASILGNL